MPDNLEKRILVWIGIHAMGSLMLVGSFGYWIGSTVARIETHVTNNTARLEQVYTTYEIAEMHDRYSTEKQKEIYGSKAN